MRKNKDGDYVLGHGWLWRSYTEGLTRDYSISNAEPKGRLVRIPFLSQIATHRVGRITLAEAQEIVKSPHMWDQYKSPC